MSGKRFILDTNAIVSLLKGNKYLVSSIEHAEWVGISIISKIEFLAFPDLSEPDARLFEEFQRRVDIIDLNENDEKLISKIINTRKKYKIKLPDAIIISTAITHNCTLLTADKELRKKVEEVEVISF